MSGPQPTLTLDSFRRQTRETHEKREESRRDFTRYSEQAADADRDYRRQLAVAFAKAKSSDMTAAQAEVEAHSEASEAKHKRDLAQSLAKSCLLRIEALEADRASLRSVATWSQAIDAVGVGGVAA